MADEVSKRNKKSQIGTGNAPQSVFAWQSARVAPSKDSLNYKLPLRSIAGDQAVVGIACAFTE